MRLRHALGAMLPTLSASKLGPGYQFRDHLNPNQQSTQGQALQVPQLPQRVAWQVPLPVI